MHCIIYDEMAVIDRAWYIAIDALIPTAQEPAKGYREEQTEFCRYVSLETVFSGTMQHDMLDRYQLDRTPTPVVQ